jgi:hypothetical protein
MKTNWEDRKRKVSIFFGDLEEQFYVPIKIAIPIIEALRLYEKIEESPENTSSDLCAIAKILLAFSGIQI